MRVLIAEDDRDLANALTGFVEECGHQAVATITGGGLEVIQSYTRVAPDCVLMDVMMPRFNGLTVCHALLSKNPNANVILISGRLASDHPFVRDAGATAFLSKPIRVSELKTLLDRIERARTEATDAVAA
jgi:CheY-like chemotaxis protein